MVTMMVCLFGDDNGDDDVDDDGADDDGDDDSDDGDDDDTFVPGGNREANSMGNATHKRYRTCGGGSPARHFSRQL